MPFQSIPSAAQVAIRAQLAGEECVNTLGFYRGLGGVVTQGMLDLLLAGLVDWVTAHWLPTQVGAYEMVELYARALDLEDSVESTNSDLATATGALAGDASPNNVSLAISFRNGLTGRTNRNRNYFPAFQEADISNNRVASGRLTPILAAYTALMGANTIASGWTWAVISRKVSTPGAPGIARAVTAVSVFDDVLDSQRRRLPKRGS